VRERRPGELQRGRLRVRGRADVVPVEHVLTELAGPARRGRGQHLAAEPLRRRVRVGVERRLGVAGVAGAAKIMPIRITDSSGTAYYSTIASGMLTSGIRAPSRTASPPPSSTKIVAQLIIAGMGAPSACKLELKCSGPFTSFA